MALKKPVAKMKQKEVEVEIEMDMEEDFEWEQIESQRIVKMDDRDILVSRRYVESDKAHHNPLLQIRFGTKVAEHLKIKKEDRLLVMADKNNPFNYLLVKSEQGYKVTEDYTKRGFAIGFRYKREGLPTFKGIKARYFLNKNFTVRMELPKEEILVGEVET